MHVQQLFTIFSLHQCLQRAVKNKQKQLSISNQHVWVSRWCVFNFVSKCASNDDAKLTIKKSTYKRYEIYVSLAGFESMALCLLVTCSTSSAIFLWLLVECCSSFLQLFSFNWLQSKSWIPHQLVITNLKLPDKEHFARHRNRFDTWCFQAIIVSKLPSVLCWRYESYEIYFFIFIIVWVNNFQAPKLQAVLSSVLVRIIILHVEVFWKVGRGKGWVGARWKAGLT